MIATTAGIVKVAIQVKKYCKQRAEKLEALEQVRVSGIHELTSLRTVFKSYASSFDTYNTDVINLLGLKAKGDIGEIMKDTLRVMEASEGTVSKLRALTKTKICSKSDVDVLRQELAHALKVIECLQTAFSTSVGRLLHKPMNQLTCTNHRHINLETLRRVSLGNAEHEPHGSKALSKRRDSELESIAPVSRQNTIETIWSSHTLTPFSPNSVFTTGSSSGSSSGSTNGSSGITLVASNQLRSAVDEKDSRRIEQLIRERTTEGEVSTLFRTRSLHTMNTRPLTMLQKELWKLSAIFLACSRRRKSIVPFLLSLKPNVCAIDESGLGVMHATIGLSQNVCDAKEQAIADILKLLVDRHPQLIRSTDRENRLPLHYCAMTGNCRAAQYIISVDRDRMNAIDRERKTPLYHACEHPSPNKRLVKLLLQYGGNFGIRKRPKMKDNIRLAPIKKLLDEEEKKGSLTLPSS